jgi:F-type H+-transporting ATPase subunit b
MGMTMDHNQEPVAEASEGHEAHEVQGLNWFEWGNKEDPALGFMIINFALLAVIVYMIMRKPISKMVTARREGLVTALKEANELREEAQKALRLATERMDTLDMEMARIREDILNAGLAESRRVTKDAERRLKKMDDESAALIEQEVARMSAEIRREVVDAIATTAQRIISEKIQVSDHDRLAKDYMKSMNEITLLAKEQ